jgi:hypothetical protein
MTFDQFLWLIAVFVFGLICASFAVGYQCGKEDTTDPRNWERAPETNPYLADDDEAWQRLLDAWAADDAETGRVDLPETFGGLLSPSLERIEQGAEPDDAIPDRERLASTSELRALAYAGDVDAIGRQVDAIIATINEENL